MSNSIPINANTIKRSVLSLPSSASQIVEGKNKALFWFLFFIFYMLNKPIPHFVSNFQKMLGAVAVQLPTRLPLPKPRICFREKLPNLGASLYKIHTFSLLSTFPHHLSLQIKDRFQTRVSPNASSSSASGELIQARVLHTRFLFDFIISRIESIVIMDWITVTSGGRP